jgi:phosphoribosyl 1,2-cyclic phosphodiesterase
MRVRFWGTRGSLPAALPGAEVEAKIASALVKASGQAFADATEARAFLAGLPFAERAAYGGNTSCVQIESGAPDGEYLLCDLGSGLRAFSQSQIEAGHTTGQTYNFLVSHVHWDHIMGFPFFVPAFIPGNTVRIYGCHDVLEQAFRNQQAQPSFPVPLSVMGAKIEFIVLEAGRNYDIAGCKVRASLQEHSGDSFGYRIERDGKSVIYSTDAEHKLESEACIDRYVDFIGKADLVIFDSMYSLADAISVKQDWGHSSNIVGVDLCHRGNVRRYCMFHHEPICSDADLDRVLAETLRYEQLMREGSPLEVLSSYDGMELEI